MIERDIKIIKVGNLMKNYKLTETGFIILILALMIHLVLSEAIMINKSVAKNNDEVWNQTYGGKEWDSASSIIQTVQFRGVICKRINRFN